MLGAGRYSVGGAGGAAAERPSGFVPMPVVQVRVVRMGVDERRMHMRMRVGLAPVPREIVGVPVMLVVAMGVRMLASRSWRVLGARAVSDTCNHTRQPAISEPAASS